MDTIEIFKAALFGLAAAGVTYALLNVPLFEPYGGYIVVGLLGVGVGLAIELYRHLSTLEDQQEILQQSIRLATILQAFASVAKERGFLEEAEQRALEKQRQFREVMEDLESGIDPAVVQENHPEFFDETTLDVGDGDGDDDEFLGFE